MNRQETNSDRAIRRALRGQKPFVKISYKEALAILMQHLAETKQLPKDSQGEFLCAVDSRNGSFSCYRQPTSMRGQPADVFFNGKSNYNYKPVTKTFSAAEVDKRLL